MQPRGWAIGALALGLTACGSVERDVPPELVAGDDACLECGMIISEMRFASGYVDNEGISHGFDDLGCLARYDETHGGADLAPAVWVMDFEAHTWKRATEAWFVRCDSVLTPMGYGIIALGDSLEAARLAAPAGAAFRYEALRQQVLEKQGVLEGATSKE